jgi:hypothetical protein
MNKTKLIFVAFLSLILASCDDAEVYEIVDIDGQGHRFNTFSGELAVVANNTLIKIPETESVSFFEKSYTRTVRGMPVDFDFLVNDSTIYWGGIIRPSVDLTDEEKELWFTNIKQSGNFIDFRFESNSTSVVYSEFRININQLTNQNVDLEEEPTAWSGNGTTSNSLDFNLISELGGVNSFGISTSYVLEWQ